ncbi:MAG: hypothetical protein J6Y02_10085 [Pseudobutyrivibrio sp.]|nr:hypothetical protein [Pseudobutyrivibrio sp.]
MYYDFKPALIDRCTRIITAVYNAYNGVINPINRSASLIILPQSADKLGYIAYTNKHVVYIFIQNLIMNYEEGIYLDFQCVFTALHELSHFDQSMDLDRYCTDMEYQSYIESGNDFNTAKFILDHIEEINAILGKTAADYDLERFDLGMLRDNFAPYQHTNIAEVYINIIDRKIRLSPQESSDLYNILHQNPDYIENILFSIKSGDYILEEFPMRYKHQWCNQTEEINRIVYWYLERFNEIRYTTTIKHRDQFRTLIFEVNIDELHIKPFSMM